MVKCEGRKEFFFSFFQFLITIRVRFRMENIGNLEFNSISFLITMNVIIKILSEYLPGQDP